VNERDSRAGEAEAEATTEARDIAARGEVTADDVVGVLRAVREARGRA
jgi:hypothetical protein